MQYGVGAKTMEVKRKQVEKRGTETLRQGVCRQPSTTLLFIATGQALGWPQQVLTQHRLA